MARAIWTGALSFGLVNIPMRLFSAVRDERPHFHLLHASDEAPVRYERICAREEKPVPWSEIVKGYEVSKGQHAVLTSEDFKRAALGRSETIDILAFVDTGAIDGRYFDTPYYLGPGKGGDRAYALLRETMRQAAKMAVAQIVFRQAQHLAAVAPVADALVFTTLRFASTLVAPRDLGIPGHVTLQKNELALAGKLVAGFAGAWKPEQYKDRYTDNLLAIIKAKTKSGREPKLKDLGPAAPRGEISDLMEQLRASLNGGRGRRPTSSPNAKPAKRGGQRRDNPLTQRGAPHPSHAA
jgi:DNA end-binding protein Ku